MAGKGSLPSGWQTIMENPAGTECKPYIQVIIDPSGEAITLSTTHSVNNIQTIVGEFNPDPTFSSEQILSDLNISFTDPDEYFAAFTSRGSRYFKNVTRITSESTTNNPVGLNSGLGEFTNGDKLTISDGNNKETFTCNSDTATDLVGWDGSLSNTYAAGAMISSIPLIGTEVEVRLKLEGQTGYVTIFRGFVREAFEWNGMRATLKLDNYLAKVFDKEMKIHASSPSATSRATISGNLESTLTWSAGASTALAAVTVYTGAKLGQWTVTMGDDVGGYNSFHVTGPDDFEDTGFTNADYYDETDATDSQIKIASADWTSPTAGDVLTFYVCANFSAKTVPEIIYEILNGYGGVAAANIDVGGTGVTDTSALTYSFNEAYHNLQGDTITFSFDSEHTIMQAILAILPHSICYLGQMLNGNLRLVALDPDFGMASLTPTVIGNPEVSSSDVINEFTVKYAWDYEAGDYQSSVIWPEGDSSNASYEIHGRKKEQEVKAPGVNN